MPHPKLKIMLIGPNRGGGEAITNQILADMHRIPGVEPRGIPCGKILEFYENAFAGIEDMAQQTRLICQHVSMAALSECVSFKPDLIIVIALAPIWPLFLEGARSMGAKVVHWLIENYRYGPADNTSPQLAEVIKHYDAVFTIQKGDCHRDLGRIGAKNLFYLPTGALIDPKRPPGFAGPQSPGYAVSFVGYPYPNRVKLFSQLAGFGLKLFGPGWAEHPFANPEIIGADRWVTTEEESNIIRNSQIGLNIHSTMGKDELIPDNDFINPRVFTIPAQGTFQLVNDCALLSELFEPGEEVAVYSDLEGLKAQLRRYLQDVPARLAMARKGYQRALKEHSYAIRIRQMLNMLGM
jgi:spore maturation protein CgeB